MVGSLNFATIPFIQSISCRKVPKNLIRIRASTETSEQTLDSGPQGDSNAGTSTSNLNFSPPANFKPPEPKRFGIRSDRALDILGASLSLIFRLGTGVFVDGYSASLVSKEDVQTDQYALEFAGFNLKESSKIGPRPEKPIEIYEFESCPFCRKVREIVAVLDLDVLYYPCPRNGPNFRPKAAEMGGKKLFPYMEERLVSSCPIWLNAEVIFSVIKYMELLSPALRDPSFGVVGCHGSLP